MVLNMTITELLTFINLICIKPVNTNEQAEVCIEYYTNCIINNDMKPELIEKCTKGRPND